MSEEKQPFEIRNPEIEAVLSTIGRKVGETLPEGWVFNLLIANVGPNGATFYVSNGNREDMIRLMIEFVEKQRKGELQ